MTVTFSSAIKLFFGVQYSIVVTVAGADVTNLIRVHRHNAGTYGDPFRTGNMKISTNGGSSWTNFPASDVAFKFAVNGDSCIVNLFGTLKQIPLADVN